MYHTNYLKMQDELSVAMDEIAELVRRVPCLARRRSPPPACACSVFSRGRIVNYRSTHDLFVVLPQAEVSACVDLSYYTGQAVFCPVVFAITVIFTG